MGADADSERLKKQKVELDDRRREVATRFGALVKSWRIEAGLTQQEVAEKIDKSYNVIGRLERGDYSPPPRLTRVIRDMGGPGEKLDSLAEVTDVNGGSVTIAEYNEHYHGTFDERTVPASTFTDYFHFKDLPRGGNPEPVDNPTQAPTPTSGSGSSTTYGETTGGVTHTWTDYTNAGGAEGPSIASNQMVQISCRLEGFTVADGNTWWYQIASSPWSGNYYASADAFYNNGATPGTLHGTPFVDTTVPVCGSGGGGAPPPPPPPPPTTYAETTGGVTHTWTNYTNAGGTEGPSIATNQTVQITCRLEGFQVADGNTWWYRIASDPWANNDYASADAFYNNGATSGSLSGTPFVDPAVPTC